MQPGHGGAYVVFADGLGAIHVVLGQEVREQFEVALVGLAGPFGQAAFVAQMIEVGPDRRADAFSHVEPR
jgi:hypothetical protein